MPRLKGSKNKRKRRDSRMVALFKLLPDKTANIILRLAQKSNIDWQRVLDDAVLEGAAELETEAYHSLIEFNERRGKVVHEREPERIDPPSEGTEEPVEAAIGDRAPSDDAAFERGFESAPAEDPQLASGSEGIEPEPREIPF